MGKHNSINPTRTEKAVPTPKSQFSEGSVVAQRIKVIVHRHVLTVRANSLMWRQLRFSAKNQNKTNNTIGNER